MPIFVKNIPAMKRRFAKIICILSLLALFNITPIEAPAQCPMCRMSAESNLKNGGTEGSGLNTGILYMLAMPYLLVATLGFVWWKNRRDTSEEA